jgi:hypothetical protein
MQLRQTDKKKMKYMVFLKRKGSLKYKVLGVYRRRKNKRLCYILFHR